MTDPKARQRKLIADFLRTAADVFEVDTSGTFRGVEVSIAGDDVKASYLYAPIMPIEHISLDFKVVNKCPACAHECHAALCGECGVCGACHFAFPPGHPFTARP